MKLFDDMTQSTASGFGFSAVRPETLGAVEYTLVTLVLDKTGSVSSFASELFAVKQTVVDACKKSPRSENLLLRVLEFNSRIDEVHGFVPLASIDSAQYVVPDCTGVTALYDATVSAVSATRAYGKALADQDYLANGLVIVVTDGGDNASRMTAADVKNEISKAVQSEQMESLRTILVGVNAGAVSDTLDSFQKEAGFDQYVEIERASAQVLARLADFVSRSISSQSQSLGTGGPSQALSF